MDNIFAAKRDAGWMDYTAHTIQKATVDIKELPMKKIVLLAQIALVALMPCTALAAPQDDASLPPVRITLYASGASVMETRPLTVIDGLIHFTLPEAVDTQSLRVSIDKAAVTDLRITKEEAAPDNGPDAVALRAARQKSGTLENEIAVLKARLDFWKKYGNGSAGDVQSAESVFTENVAGLNRQLQEAESALGAIYKEIARLEERQQARGVSESALDVTARVMRADSATGPLAVQLSYMIGACGWQSLMRLDALTTQNRIDLERIAVIEQKTGMDWSKVDLTLSTASPAARVEPPYLGGWRITPVRTVEPRLAANQAVTLDLAEEAMPMAAKSSLRASAQAPVVSEEASSECWALGVRDVPAGAPVLVTLDNRQWPAQFVRLIRPIRQSMSYLLGQVSLPESLHIPSGTAQYFVDGVFVGTGTFGFSGRQKDIAFGSDPAVTAVMTADTAQSGTHGLVGRRQSYDWHWTITVKNAHAQPVDVRVEDALPQSGDSDIAIKITDSPAAERDEQTLVWNLTVPAGGEERIRHEVSFEAPADMTVAPGR